MARFTLPRDVYFGEGTLEELKHLDGKRAIVVVGGGTMKGVGSGMESVAQKLTKR